jgi:hypothetical protein
MEHAYLKYEYSSDIRKREANDHSWQLVHYFNKGWRWRRPSDDIQISMMDLLPFQICFKYFPHIDPKLIEEIVAIRKEKDRIRKEEVKNTPPIKIQPFDTLQFPKITKAIFPTNPITELVGVQPLKHPLIKGKQ